MKTDLVSTLRWMIQGFFYPFRGIAFIAHHRRLLWILALPFSLNAILFSVFFWFAVPRAWTGASGFLPGKDTWYGAIVYYVLIAVLAVLLAVVLIYAFTLLGNILLGPFNDLISEKVERIYAGTGYEEAFSLKTVLADILRSIRVEIGKLLVYLAGLMLLLSLNLVPLVGSVFSGSLIMVYTLYFLGWEYIDYSMERWKYSLRLKLKTATANGSAFLGFGAGASLLLFIPLANLMAIPVCAIGATLLFCDLRKNHRLPDST